MSNFLHVNKDTIALEGFEGMNVFNISFLWERVVIFQKTTPTTTPQFSFTSRNNIICNECVTLIKEFYNITDDVFSLEFEYFSAVNLYRCIKNRFL